MSRPIQLHAQDQQHLFQLHAAFKKTACRIGCSAAAASFLVIGALIIISAACLCLSLPGVNVVNNVILPGVLPGSGALLLSIPFIVYTVHKVEEKNRRRRELIDWNVMLLNHHQVHAMKKSAAASFIKDNFFKPNWAKEYASKVIGDIKERYPKDKDAQSPEDKALIKALDKAKIEIFKKTK